MKYKTFDFECDSARRLAEKELNQIDLHNLELRGYDNPKNLNQKWLTSDYLSKEVLNHINYRGYLTGIVDVRGHLCGFGIAFTRFAFENKKIFDVLNEASSAMNDPNPLFIYTSILPEDGQKYALRILVDNFLERANFYDQDCYEEKHYKTALVLATRNNFLRNVLVEDFEFDESTEFYAGRRTYTVYARSI